MELVSKFMGHAHVSTTSAYWVPTAMEIAEKMNNPFTGQFQKGIQETSQMKQELDALYKKFLALAKLHHQLRGLLRVSAVDGCSAAEMERRYEEVLPNEQALLRAIMESTSSSISGEQAMSADQCEEDEAILAAASGDEGEASNEDEPGSRRARFTPSP